MLHDSNIDMISPVLGFVGAGLSTAALWVAQIPNAVPPEAQGWVQLGGTVALIGCLSYACRTLWMALQDSRRETTAAVATAVAATAAAATATAAAVQASEDRMTRERASFIAAKDALEREIRTDWKQQNDKLIAVLDKLDPPHPE